MLPEVAVEQGGEAARVLLLSAVVLFAFRTARGAAETNGKWVALRNGVLWCVGLALFAALSVGQPSCEEPDDPLRGGCSQYADDGYEPTQDERIGRFIFVFLLLTVPVGFGVAEARKREPNPWRQPGAGADAD